MRWEGVGSDIFMNYFPFAENKKYYCSYKRQINFFWTTEVCFFLQKEDNSWTYLSQLLLTSYFILVCLNEKNGLLLILFLHGYSWFLHVKLTYRNKFAYYLHLVFIIFGWNGCTILLLKSHYLKDKGYSMLYPLCIQILGLVAESVTFTLKQNLNFHWWMSARLLYCKTLKTAPRYLGWFQILE